MSDDVTARDDRLTEERDAAQCEAADLGHDYDRRGERLWRLAAKAGWVPGNSADNDAIAELYVADALAERDRLAAAMARVEALAEGAAYAGRHINGYSYVLVTDLGAALADARDSGTSGGAQ